MRRLDAREMLDRKIASGTVTPRLLRLGAELLIHFYRKAPPVDVAAAQMVHRFRRGMEADHPGPDPRSDHHVHTSATSP